MFLYGCWTESPVYISQNIERAKNIGMKGFCVVLRFTIAKVPFFGSVTEFLHFRNDGFIDVELLVVLVCF